MATAKDAELYIELSQKAFAKQNAISTDNKTFRIPNIELFSSFAGKNLQVWVNGIKNGGEARTKSTADTVSITETTAVLNGENVVIESSDVTIVRASTDTHIVNSIVIDSTKSLVAVQGLEGTSFTTIRGEAGGAPLIPTGAIEVCQVMTSTQASAILAVSEIEQLDGLSKETADDIYSTNALTGEIEFNDELQPIHVDNETKTVMAQGFEPSYVKLSEVKDFTIPEETVSNTTEEYYGLVKNNTSFGLGTGSFKTVLENGIDDPIMKITGENVHIKWKPSRYVEKYLIGQSIIGVTRNYPVSGDITGDISLNSQFKFIPYIP